LPQRSLCRRPGRPEMKVIEGRMPSGEGGEGEAPIHIQICWPGEKRPKTSSSPFLRRACVSVSPPAWNPLIIAGRKRETHSAQGEARLRLPLPPRRRGRPLLLPLFLLGVGEPLSWLASFRSLLSTLLHPMGSQRNGIPASQMLIVGEGWLRRHARVSNSCCNLVRWPGEREELS